MVIYLGNKKPIKLYFDETEIGGVYLGTNPIYIPSEESDESDSDVGPDDTLIDSNTLGVFHFENSSFSNAVIDSSLQALVKNDSWQVTSSGGKFGSGQAETTKKSTSVSSQYSLYCNPSLSSNSDLTVDFWACGTKAGIISFGGSNFNYNRGTLSLQFVNNNTQIHFYVGDTLQTYIDITNDWHHYAYEREDGKMNMYLDGEKILSDILDSTALTSSGPYIFKTWTGNENGSWIYLNELRISDIARYHGQNFIPPDQQYHY